ncbi:MAG: hypothetical protein H7Y27_11675, partial [Gemmatimonadaceae bacterium]|nr:hypothetical protein [Chitinophagaceae bacterium]
MEANEIIALWKSYDRKLDENLSLNRRNAIDITKIKVRSFLSSMKPIKIFTLLTGILWVVFVDFIIIKAWPGANIFFLGSAMIQVLLTKFAIGVYLYQLYQIYQSGIDEPVVATQSRLASLQSSTILVTRILFLQLPV